MGVSKSKICEIEQVRWYQWAQVGEHSTLCRDTTKEQGSWAKRGIELLLVNNAVIDLLTGPTDFSAQTWAGTSSWNHACLNIRARTLDSSHSWMTAGNPGTCWVLLITSNTAYIISFDFPASHISCCARKMLTNDGVRILAGTFSETMNALSSGGCLVGTWRWHTLSKWHCQRLLMLATSRCGWLIHTEWWDSLDLEIEDLTLHCKEDEAFLKETEYVLVLLYNAVSFKQVY